MVKHVCTQKLYIRRRCTECARELQPLTCRMHVHISIDQEMPHRYNGKQKKAEALPCSSRHFFLLLALLGRLARIGCTASYGEVGFERELQAGMDSLSGCR